MTEKIKFSVNSNQSLDRAYIASLLNAKESYPSAQVLVCNQDEEERLTSYDDLDAHVQ